LAPDIFSMLANKGFIKCFSLKKHLKQKLVINHLKFKTMKKSSFALALATVLSFTSQMAFSTKIVVKRSGSKDGTHYDYVNETHDDKTDTHTLTCLRPGKIVCGWTKSPTSTTKIIGVSGSSYDVEDLIAIADKRIADYFSSAGSNEVDTPLNEKVVFDGIIIMIHAKKQKETGAIDSEITIYDKNEEIK